MSPSHARYAPRWINLRFAEVNARGDRLMVTASDLRDASDAGGAGGAGGHPKAAAVPIKPLPYAYAVHTGMIFQPIVQFVRLVAQVPELSANAAYRAKAAAYLEAAEQAVAIYDDEWREDAKTGEGWLIWRRGAPISFDGSDQPHNQYLALGSVMAHLSAVASSPALRQKYRYRATKMARTFRNDLKPTKAGGYSWTYFWTRGKAFNGWKAADDVSDYQPTFIHAGKAGGHQSVEDSSHGHIDVTFARWEYDYGLGVFDKGDMKRFAATYTKQILAGERSSDLVDGGGGQGKYDNTAAIGVQFAKWDQSIVEKVARLYRSYPPVGAPQGRLLGTAYLNLAAKGAW